jgi:hypothetical protein
MFPTNCDGCYTFRDIIEERKKKDGFQCMGKNIPKCPCSTCITKVTCHIKIRCLDFLDSCVKYPTHEYEQMIEVLTNLVPDNLLNIIINANKLNNMEDTSDEVCKEERWNKNSKSLR